MFSRPKRPWKFLPNLPWKFLPKRPGTKARSWCSRSPRLNRPNQYCGSRFSSMLSEKRPLQYCASLNRPLQYWGSADKRPLQYWASFKASLLSDNRPLQYCGSLTDLSNLASVNSGRLSLSSLLSLFSSSGFALITRRWQQRTTAIHADIFLPLKIRKWKTNKYIKLLVCFL